MRALKLFIGAGFGSGYSPVAPGTFGSLLALLILYPILQFIFTGVLLFVLISSLLSLWVSATCEEAWGKDPGRMVMDEFAGQGLVFIGIGMTGVLQTDIAILVIGFTLFRVFDIWKPLGIDRIQKVGGAWGILLDDLIAGFYAFICLKTLIFFLPNFFGAV